MATPSQILANRENAKKSTGPKTEEGKAKSSKNRLSHGFNSNDAVIAGESEQDFEALLDALINEHQPATITEQILVEKLAQNQWLALRAFRFQTRSFAPSGRYGFGEIEPTRHLALMIRYHGAAERAFHKAHAELVKAQKERKMSEIGFVPQTARQTQPPEPPKLPATVPQPEFPLPVAAEPPIFLKTVA